MTKILFIVVPYGGWIGISTARKNQFTAFPYGVMSIATYLKKHAPSVESYVFDCNITDNYLTSLSEILNEYNPDIVACSMTFDTSCVHLHGILEVLERGTWRIVFGGAATTENYKDILTEFSSIDAICYGEGEMPFLDLVKTGRFDNPSWITHDTCMQNKRPVRTKVENLDDVIDLDYSFVDIDDYTCREAFSPFACDTIGKQFYIIASRGCKFNCRFCMNSANPDKSMRYASIGAIVTHVEKLIKMGMTTLTFYDDQLLLNKKWAKELFRSLIPYHLRIECPNGLSVAFIDDELAGLMKQAGMVAVRLAIESGSPYVLNELMNKPLKVGMIKPVVNILHNHGFWVQGFIIFGMPGETDAHRLETRTLIKDVELDWAQINTACPIKGSLLYKECMEKGYLPEYKLGDSIFTVGNREYYINQPDYTIEHIKDEAYRMNLDVNFVNNRSMRVGKFSVASKAFHDVTTLVPDHAFAYYYLSVAYNKIGQTSLANDYLIKYCAIVARDPFWEKWAKEFGLMIPTDESFYVKVTGE